MGFTSHAGVTTGALAAPFVFLGAAVAAWGSGTASPSIWAVSLACLAFVLSRQWANRWRFTPLALAVTAYAGWTIFHTAFISGAYNTAGLYDPLFLVAGFAIGRALDRSQRPCIYRAIALLVVLLCAWALGQALLTSSSGHAHFETGSALASTINLVLAPTIVALAHGNRSRTLVVLAVLLFAALCATLSRAGMLALLLGLCLTIALVGMKASLRWQPVLLVALGLALCALLYLAAGRWWPLLLADLSAANLDSAKSRLELYQLAWSTTTFGLGIGYLTFRYVLEVGRADVPSYGESSFTYFVHNDYLQAMLELGLPGFVALVAIVVLALLTGRRLVRSKDEGSWESLAVLAGVCTVAVHALLDFPLHIPLCLLLFGFGIGVLDHLSGSVDRKVPAGQVQRLATLILAMGVTILLARPVIAEAAAAYGMRKWALGETRSGAYGFELARRMDPRDWRYHLYAGQFWFAQAAENNDAEQAKFADAAFAAAMAANPLEPTSALGRAFTQLRYRSILPAPAQPAAIRAWADQAVLVAPLNATVRKEHEAILRRLAATQ